MKQWMGWVAGMILATVAARADLCGQCADGMYTMDSKKCPVCKKGWTGSGALKMCRGCSAKLGQCERCGAAIRVSKVSPEQAAARLKQWREQMEKEQPGSTKAPGADLERQAAAVVTRWLEAMNNQDPAAALAVSETPFCWDRQVVDAAALKTLLQNWVEDKAPKKTPLRFSAPVFLCRAAVKDVGEGLLWMVAFDQSGRTDDAIVFYVKPGQEVKVAGFRD